MAAGVTIHDLWTNIAPANSKVGIADLNRDGLVDVFSLHSSTR